MTQLQFIDILKRNSIDDKKIDYILSKNIKRILGRNIDELEKIIKILSNENLEIKNCLSVLAQGKAEEIEKIIKILKSENMEVSKCPTVLAHGKSEEIERIIKILKSENINLTNIREYNMNYIFYKFKYDDLKNIFLHRKDIYSDDEIKLYIRLKYSVNCYYDKQKLDEICNNLNINISKIVDVFKTKNVVLNETLTKKIYDENFKLWIGKSYKCTSEQLEKNKEMILKLCIRVAKVFAVRNNCMHLEKDLEGFVMDIIMEKCGDLFYCFEGKILEEVLYSYCKKSLYNYYDLNTKTIIDNLYGSYDSNTYDDEQSEILQDIDLEIDEREKIQYMSYLLENGVIDFENKIKSKYNMNDNDYTDFIGKVKTKILSNKN